MKVTQAGQSATRTDASVTTAAITIVSGIAAGSAAVVRNATEGEGERTHVAE